MHKSGVDVVDRVIGGLAPGLPLVLAGPAGAGRTVLCLQLAAAALAAQNIVAFVSGEPPPLLIRQAQTLGLDLEEPLRSEQLILLELEASAAAGLASAGGKALMRAVLAEHPAIGTVVIDPITALTNELVDESRLRSIARELLEDVRHADLVFSVETERPVMDVPVERVLMEICGSYLELSRQSDGTRSLAVRKTRAGAGRSEAVEFSIGDQGAVVEAEVRVEPPQLPPAPAAVVTEALVAPMPEVSEIASSADAAVSRPPAETRSGPAGVLVVVEDAPQRSQLSGWLETSYAVAAASDGFQAVTMLMAQRPDIIVLDLSVSRVSGYEVLLGLRRACPELPILVIAHDTGRPGYKLGPMVLGATDVLAKNVSQFELMQRVAFALQLAGPPPELLGLDEASELFGGFSASRQVPASDFRSRTDRALEFGERFGVPSSLIAIATATGADLDRLMEAADSQLRFEDAAVILSKRRVVLLLVGSDLASAPQVIERLLKALDSESESDSAIEIEYSATPSRPSSELRDLRTLFQDMSRISEGHS